MLIAARTVDRRLEPKRRDFAERRDGQRVEHPVRVEPVGGQRRINFLPAVLARDVRVIKPRAPKATRSRSFADSVLAVAKDARNAQRR
jgi:hypothetical protein